MPPVTTANPEQTPGLCVSISRMSLWPRGVQSQLLLALSVSNKILWWDRIISNSQSGVAPVGIGQARGWQNFAVGKADLEPERPGTGGGRSQQHPATSPEQLWAPSQFHHCFQGDACSGSLCHCHCSQQLSPEGCLPRKETTSAQKLLYELSSGSVYGAGDVPGVRLVPFGSWSRPEVAPGPAHAPEGSTQPSLAAGKGGPVSLCAPPASSRLHQGDVRHLGCSARSPAGR